MLSNGGFALFSCYGYYATAGKVPGPPQATLRQQSTYIYAQKKAARYGLLFKKDYYIIFQW